MSNFIGQNTIALKKGDPEPATVAAGAARVYNMRFCPFAQRVIIYLAKKEIPVEVININLSEKPEWYFKKHPLGQVPAFEKDEKVTIESGLIPEYLDDIYPENRILPSDPYEKYQQRLIADKLSSVLSGMFALYGGVRSGGFTETPEAAIKGVETAEKVLEKKFFSGDQAGWVDYLVFPILERYWIVSNVLDTKFNGASFPGSEEYPKLTQWFSEIQKLPEIIISTHSLESYKQYLSTFAAGKSDFDIGI